MYTSLGYTIQYENLSMQNIKIVLAVKNANFIEKILVFLTGLLKTLIVGTL